MKQGTKRRPSLSGAGSLQPCRVDRYVSCNYDIGIIEKSSGAEQIVDDSRRKKRQNADSRRQRHAGGATAASVRQPIRDHTASRAEADVLRCKNDPAKAQARPF